MQQAHEFASDVLLAVFRVCWPSCWAFVATTMLRIEIVLFAICFETVVHECKFHVHVLVLTGLYDCQYCFYDLTCGAIDITWLALINFKFWIFLLCMNVNFMFIWWFSLVYMIVNTCIQISNTCYSNFNLPPRSWKLVV
jgi:hypothetical protein